MLRDNQLPRNEHETIAAQTKRLLSEYNELLISTGWRPTAAYDAQIQRSNIELQKSNKPTTNSPSDQGAGKR